MGIVFNVFTGTFDFTGTSGGGGSGSVNSVVGTTNRVTSSGGTDPIIDISPNYVGQSSITTLGTITTGTWQGTAISDTYLSGISWSKVSGTPTTLSGYGITDTYTQTQSDARYGQLATTNTWALKQTFTTAPTITPFNTAGFIKNDASGNLSTGLISISDSPLYKAIGVKFTDTFNRASLGSNWTKQGSTATFTIVSNQLQVGAGAGNLSEFIYYNPYFTNTNKMSIKASYIMGTLNTAGIFFGFTGASDLAVHLDTTTSSASTLKMYIGGIAAQFSLDTGTETISVSTNDVITFKLVYLYNRISVSIIVNSTIAMIASLKYETTASGNSGPVARYIKIGSVGGTHTVTSISTSDLNYKYSELTICGDSISWGAGVPEITDSWSYKFQKSYSYINNYSGPGMTMQLLATTAILNDIISSGTKRVLIFLGTNDFASSRTLAQVQTDTATVKTTLEAAGIIVDFATPLPRAAVQSNLDLFTAWLISTYGSTNKIINFAGIINTTNVTSDTIHPNLNASNGMYDYACSEYSDILTPPFEYTGFTSISTPRYFNKSSVKGSTVLSATIANTDIDIPVSTIAGFPTTGYAIITDNTSSEIIQFFGAVNNKLKNCIRGLFGTTALTVAASPGNFAVSVITEIDYTSTSTTPGKLFYQKDSSSQNYFGYNATGPIVSGAIFDFQFRASGNQFMMLRSSIVGGGVGLWLSKATSTDSSNIFFGESVTARFRIQHTTSNTLLIGRSNGNELVINGANVGINSTTQVYRTTNAGSDVTPKFIIDADGSITAGLGFGFDSTNGVTFTQANGTRRIASVGMKIVNATTTAGSEAGDLGIYTQSAGAALALRVQFGSNIATFQNLGSEAKKVIVSSAATLTLDKTGSTYVFTGTTTTWTLPAILGNTDLIYRIKNRGSGNITLTRAGSDNLYDTASTTSVTILPGESRNVQNDGTFWIVM